MSDLLYSIRRRFKPVKPIDPGIYHFQAPPDDPRNYRLHLRIEPDGQGVMIVNAATILHLNQTAVEYGYYLVNNWPMDRIIDTIVSRYRVNKEQAHKDYLDFVDRIETLVTRPDLDPVTFLDFELQAPHTGDISAPYRLDCALTYRLRPESNPLLTPTKRLSRELTTEEWITILDKAWQVGVPHIIFTGGEPTLREDLSQLIAHAETNGQVTGLLTDGINLLDQSYLKSLLVTGLDHVLIVWTFGQEKNWEILGNIANEDLFMAVHLTLSEETQSQILPIIKRLAEIKINALSLSTISAGLIPQLQKARNYAADQHLPLIWDLPVPYSRENPVTLEVVDQQITQGAGRAWLYVEPDGDVLPAQGINKVIGNLVSEPWEKIWLTSKNSV